MADSIKSKKDGKKHRRRTTSESQKSSHESLVSGKEDQERPVTKESLHGSKMTDSITSSKDSKKSHRSKNRKRSKMPKIRIDENLILDDEDDDDEKKGKSRKHEKKKLKHRKTNDSLVSGE